MKNLLMLVAVLNFAVAFAQKKELPIRILDATKRNWVSGAPGGRNGTKYSIEVYINTKQSLEVMFLWIGKENVPFDFEQMNLEIQKKPGLGDTVLITSNLVHGEKLDFEPRRLPIDYKGDALIQCKVDGKARYFIVKKFSELPQLNSE